MATIPIPRFTVRRLMIVVAIVGVIVAIEMGRRRREVFLDMANRHATEEPHWRRAAEIIASAAEEARSNAFERRKAAEMPNNTEMRKFLGEQALKWDARVDECDHSKSALLVLADFHANLRAKYEKAARYPWMSVAPDPPEPLWPTLPLPTPGPSPFELLPIPDAPKPD